MFGRFKGQPRGVYVMFATEFWERFSYYGFMGIMVLFMVADPVAGGLGYDRSRALFLFGLFTGFIWFMPLLGGWLADKFLGPRLAVLLGCIGLAVGNFLLATSSFSAKGGQVDAAMGFFVIGILTMIAGAGLFKSNASALLGQLFGPNDPRREVGFILFYMGINMGALVAPFGAGTAGERVGWGWGFLLAGVGMLIGFLVFAFAARRAFPAVVATPAEAAAPKAVIGRVLIESQHVHLILLMAVFATFYMAGQQTYGGVMNLYAEERVDRMVGGMLIPTTWFMALNPLLVVLLGSTVADLWRKRAEKSHRIVFVEKVTVGLLLMSSSFLFMIGVEYLAPQSASPLVLVIFYILITSAELCVFPAGLVEVSRRSPKEVIGIMMGVWIFTMGGGSFLAGILGSYANELGNIGIFAVLAAIGLVAAVVLLPIEYALRKSSYRAVIQPAR
jgi:POT family proton-dependent oligopeptide transporter